MRKTCGSTNNSVGLWVYLYATDFLLDYLVLVALKREPQIWVVCVEE